LDARARLEVAQAVEPLSEADGLADFNQGVTEARWLPLARHFASWFGLTPKEYSSGSTRKLGRISKRGDRYLRMLLTHGARAVLRSATLARQAGRQLDGLRQWITEVEARSNHNKAACAMANKLARICYACLRDGTFFDAPVARPNKKLERTAFAIAA
jgi:hypothetical protein